MSIISINKTIELKKELEDEYGASLVILGFSYHFESSSHIILTKFSEKITQNEYRFVSLSKNITNEKYTLEVSSKDDGDVHFLKNMQKKLSDISSSFEGISYLGATPIGSGIRTPHASQ